VVDVGTGFQDVLISVTATDGDRSSITSTSYTGYRNHLVPVPTNAAAQEVFSCSRPFLKPLLLATLLVKGGRSASPERSDARWSLWKSLRSFPCFLLYLFVDQFHSMLAAIQCRLRPDRQSQEEPTQDRDG